MVAVLVAHIKLFAAIILWWGLYAGVGYYDYLEVVMFDRVNQFYIGQTWQSPRGTEYKVVNFKPGKRRKLAVLQTTPQFGKPRKIYRDYDDVAFWVLVSDSIEAGGTNE